MLFVLENAPLKPWQLDVLSIIRDEAYYFAPQGQTKIMNEGWASYWHSTIMTRQGLDAGRRDQLLRPSLRHDGQFARPAESLQAGHRAVPRHRRPLEPRAASARNTTSATTSLARQNWDTAAGLGRQKIFEVRRIHNDLTFIDEFLTLDFCREHKLFSFGYNPADDAYEIESREFPKIKQRLLFNLTNVGRPLIAVRDGNYKNRGELFLEHQFNGVELKTSYAHDTLANLYRLWTRPVHIETVIEDVKTIAVVRRTRTQNHASEVTLLGYRQQTTDFEEATAAVRSKQPRRAKTRFEPACHASSGQSPTPAWLGEQPQFRHGYCSRRGWQSDTRERYPQSFRGEKRHDDANAGHRSPQLAPLLRSGFALDRLPGSRPTTALRADGPRHLGVRFRSIRTEIGCVSHGRDRSAQASGRNAFQTVDLSFGTDQPGRSRRGPVRGATPLESAAAW